MAASNTTGRPACDAFPDGIPQVIWDNQFDHRQHYALDGQDDGGLVWAANPNYAYPSYALPMDPADVLTAAADVAEGAMIALVPANPETLAIPGGEPADQLHCTLLYLGAAADLDEATQAAIVDLCADIAETYPPVQADGFGIGVFNPTGAEPCVVLLCSGEALEECHEAVCEVIDPAEDQHVPWIPHVTLIYADPGDGSVVADVVDACGPVTFDRLRVAFAGVVTDFPFTGSATSAPDDLQPDTPEVEAYPEPIAEGMTSDQALASVGAGAAIVREVWDGCPRCFAPVHSGPCRVGL